MISGGCFYAMKCELCALEISLFASVLDQGLVKVLINMLTLLLALAIAVTVVLLV